jgi:hypothetical protein
MAGVPKVQKTIEIRVNLLGIVDDEAEYVQNKPLVAPLDRQPLWSIFPTRVTSRYFFRNSN